ncbi:MAG: Protein of unknown function (DUF2628) [Roseibaca calidilacus]|uniref:PDZ domain-containing protein n=1 Tax=Roseibaca calidilacus TaxID=1666912 RepID=A0A0P7X4P3_9RHOB|nr:hypothetical protein [Roseibaca calidilacus]KPP95554.1 MAG: Protein of unknown function (DUF2628) [Roseibaca calidilacus]CUX82100.1 hypothetical protein Ga0058931_2166 [Roseibaca calidilacus]
MADDKTPESVLVLKRCRTEDAGHVFGLRGGDILLGVNGTAWRGSVAALQKRILQHPAPSALSFQRKDAVFTILTDRADLGQWQAEPVPQTLAALPDTPETLRNWEIVASPRGGHDLFSTAPSLLALVAPPIWLAQSRLWSGLALFVAVCALGLPVGWPLIGCVWLAAGLHLWRNGVQHQRLALQLEGYSRAAIIAAASEASAMAGWRALNPNARFRFAAPPAPAKQPASELG